MREKQGILYASLGLIGAAITWGAGWLIYSALELAAVIDPLNAQNVILILAAIVATIVIIKAFQKRATDETSILNLNNALAEHLQKENIEAPKLQQQLEKLTNDILDLKTANKLTPRPINITLTPEAPTGSAITRNSGPPAQTDETTNPPQPAPATAEKQPQTNQKKPTRPAGSSKQPTPKQPQTPEVNHHVELLKLLAEATQQNTPDYQDFKAHCNESMTEQQIKEWGQKNQLVKKLYENPVFLTAVKQSLLGEQTQNADT